jgi:hypothetical protein
MIKSIVYIIGFLTSIYFLNQDINPQLKFQLGDQSVNIKSLTELQDSLHVIRVQLFDPYYKKNKEFKGFLLSQLFEFGFEKDINLENYTNVIFEAADGYEAICSIDKIKESGGYVVFEDVEFSGWERIKPNGISPAPFYVVWKKSHQTHENGFPWTWQLSGIKLVTFKDQYPNVYPQGVSENSNIFAGFTLFREKCLQCHAMNQQGGKVGPDLNAPKSILSYRSEFMIKEMIKHPSKYRYTNMPDHEDLSNYQLDNLIEYFHHMNEKKN